MKGKLGTIVGTGMLLLAAAAMPALGQAGGGGGGGGGGFGGGGGGGGRGGRGGNPAQFQQMRLQQIQQQIGATDEEWAAIQPKVDAVLTAQRDTQANGMRGGGGGRRGGGAAAAPAGGTQTEVQVAQAALQAALDNKDSPPELIKEKLQALRDARARAREVLKKAQTDLQALLTQRQEAVMVELGILE